MTPSSEEHRHPHVPDAEDQSLQDLQEAVVGFDDRRVTELLDACEADHGIEDTIRAEVLPCLLHIGVCWERGQLSVAQEHLASEAIRQWLAGRVDPPTHAFGTIILACPPGERHDLPLLATAVVLSRLGWRVYFVGGDAPLGDVAAMAERLRPQAIVMSATRPVAFRAGSAVLRRLARSHLVALAGAGATEDVVVGCDSLRLTGDPVSGAHELTELLRSSAA